MNDITDTFYRNITGVIKLRMEIKSLVKEVDPEDKSDRNTDYYMTPKNERIAFYDKHIDITKNKIFGLKGIIRKAVDISLKANMKCLYEPEDSEIETYLNDQIEWESNLIQNYLFLLLLADEDKFVKTINTFGETPYKEETIHELLNSIRLINDYKQLLEKREELKNRNDQDTKIKSWISQAKNDLLIDLRLEELQGEIDRLRDNISNNSPNSFTGFNCQLDPTIVKKVYNVMVTEKGYVHIDENNFMNLFSRRQTKVTKQAVWQIKARTSKRGKRGNQSQLYFFLEKMLQRKLTNEDKRIAAGAFVDDIGTFFHPKFTRPDKDEDNAYNKFDFLLKDIIPTKI